MFSYPRSELKASVSMNSSLGLCEISTLTSLRFPLKAPEHVIPGQVNKIPLSLHICAKCSELPSNISTMVLKKYVILKIDIKCSGTPPIHSIQLNKNHFDPTSGHENNLERNFLEKMFMHYSLTFFWTMASLKYSGRKNKKCNIII